MENFLNLILRTSQHPEALRFKRLRGHKTFPDLTLPKDPPRSFEGRFHPLPYIDPWHK